ncbi:hypothetical protein [Streptomyces sp. NPDC050988]|uniref:hypothetical protein n=1 Tax=Streptomyces sp. NPDC050988 TaxID=3365637 RepID=UPI0037B3EFA8
MERIGHQAAIGVGEGDAASLATPAQRGDQPSSRREPGPAHRGRADYGSQVIRFAAAGQEVDFDPAAAPLLQCQLEGGWWTLADLAREPASP